MPTLAPCNQQHHRCCLSGPCQDQHRKSTVLLLAWQGAAWEPAWASCEAFEGYAQLYIAALGLAGDVDALQAMLTIQRKRLRQLTAGPAQERASPAQDRTQALGANLHQALLAALHEQLSKLLSWIAAAPTPSIRVPMGVNGGESQLLPPEGRFALCRPKHRFGSPKHRFNPNPVAVVHTDLCDVGSHNAVQL